MNFFPNARKKKKKDGLDVKHVGSWVDLNEGKPESESMLFEENNVDVYWVSFLNSVNVGRKLEGHNIRAYNNLKY